MVEATPASVDILTKLFNQRTQMVIAELLPYLELKDLINMYQVNGYIKSLMDPGSSRCLRFDVLFANQGNMMEIAPEDWKEQITTA